MNCHDNAVFDISFSPDDFQMVCNIISPPPFIRFPMCLTQSYLPYSRQLHPVTSLSESLMFRNNCALLFYKVIVVVLNKSHSIPSTLSSLLLAQGMVASISGIPAVLASALKTLSSTSLSTLLTKPIPLLLPGVGVPRSGLT